MRLLVLIVAALCAFAAGAATAASNVVRTDNVAASLVAETAQLRPGERAWVALRLDIREGWHTYWRNPGDSGEPTQIEWTLPDGVAASGIHWPYPEKIPVGPLANYGYGGTVLHLVEISVPPQWPAGKPVPLRAQARWLVCADICIPEEGELALDLPTGAGPTTYRADGAALFGAARAKLPVESPWPAAFVRDGDGLSLALRTGADTARVRDAAFFPFAWKVTEPAAPQAFAAYADGLAIRMQDAGAKGPIAGVVVLRETDGAREIVRAVAVDAAIEPARPAWLAGPARMGQPPGGPALGLWRALAFALLGGAILNLMPCVFPVLSVKALSLVSHAHDRRAARLGGLAYAAGALVFMSAVGALLLGLRAAGAEIGWGFQLQEPAFVAAMALLMFAMGLWLSGVLTLGGGMIGAGQGLAAMPGLAGSFFTGALAALVATPCTAPFMGAAVGYAVVQPWPAALGVMLALGLGLALPYLALSFAPGLARMLPRPGLWMERLKQALAFPLYATAAWLVWVLAQQAGPQGVIAALGAMVLIAFAAWLRGATADAGRRWRFGGGAAAGAVALLGVALAVASPGAEAPGPAGASAARSDGGGPQAEAYSEARLAALRAEGKAVFVNLTAAWCITCQVNERVALSSARIAGAFDSRGVVYLKGDWTNRDPEITRLLAAHGRSGVPLYLVYPAGAAEAVVLPQLLTETIVLGAVERIPVLAERPAMPSERRS